MRVLGIEGTAWCASAALHDTETDETTIFSDAYQPESGGINPSEAAEHMSNAIPDVVEQAYDHAAETYDHDATPSGGPGDEKPIDGVAFSRGPGLGPCLRIVGSAARALSLSLGVPLVGVNHMVAHLEIGRHESGFENPICLNASGANAHVLGYHNGRYRVLGETMDTGVGNALDKFTRHVGWQHPGGPKVEAHAKAGEYVDLPYVVKGMDFSFSGIMSAAKAEVDDGTPVDDVCCGLQETIFAMLTEVSERALSLTGRDELVLGGGVGQNARLHEMLESMCEERGAKFFAPETRFLRDNAGMIAVTGAMMLDAGDTLDVASSHVDSDFRPDQVDVTWREDSGSVVVPRTEDGALRGAEAIIEEHGDTITKTRRPKAYRHPALDSRLRRDRTVLEARLTSEARRHGVPTPAVWDVDVPASTIELQHVGDSDLRDALTEERVAAVGGHLAKIHDAGFVHGDPTVRNVRVETNEADRTFVIDFGLGYHTDDIEDYAMDCHVFEQSIHGTADDPVPLIDAFEAAYREAGEARVLEQLREIEGRGRYQGGSTPE